ncbi:MAG TPA: hypothetical protein VL633_06185, partial [Bacteroidota bacterium]|nr:hypothetical protein [Bacteroidota bacterium]
MSCAAFSATWASQAKLTSDKSDYQPGETVILTGSGYLPGETVTLEVHHADGSAYHSSWTVVADGSGGFTTSWVVLNDCLNHLLVATATGAASGSTASAYFWDATSWTLTISPTSSGTSETHTYTITATNTGTGVIGCITDTVPSVFTGLGSQSIVSASGHSWSITLTGNTIGLTANSNPDRLNTNETIVFSISATSPASATGSPFTWSGNAVANTNCTGASYPVPTSGQPTVSLCTPPSTSNAGPDQSVCATTATLAGSTPSVGTGAWTVIAGSASVTTPASPTSGVTGLSVGANTFVWTITASGCGSSSDTITITRSASPTTSNAGPDQTVC